LETTQKDFLQLNSIKNNYLILQQENEKQKSTIKTLE